MSLGRIKVPHPWLVNLPVIYSSYTKSLEHFFLFGRSILLMVYYLWRGSYVEKKSQRLDLEGEISFIHWVTCWARLKPGIGSCLHVSHMYGCYGSSSALVGSYIRNAAARIQASTHMGCQSSRQWLNSLCHNAGPSWWMFDKWGIKHCEKLKISEV